MTTLANSAIGIGEDVGDGDEFRSIAAATRSAGICRSGIPFRISTLDLAARRAATTPEPRATASSPKSFAAYARFGGLVASMVNRPGIFCVLAARKGQEPHGSGLTASISFLKSHISSMVL